MVRRADAVPAVVGLVVGVLIGLGWNWADSPDPAQCARIGAVMSDPESSASRGPHAAAELEQAWDDAGCAEVGK